MQELFASLWTILGLGFLMGLRHAIEPDHLAAVSLLARKEKRIRNTTSLGLLWGLGHFMTILLAGLAVLLFKVNVSLLNSSLFENLIATVLLFAGIRILFFQKETTTHTHLHEHGSLTHEHPHFHLGRSHNHNHNAFFMGALQGLAGSAFLTLLVLSATSTTLQGMLFILFFGLGSLTSMMAATSLLVVPFRTIKGKFLEKIIAVLSIIIAIGLFWR